MTKRTFTSAEWFHLTELAHASVLSGLIAARKWESGELKFQGGTSLHLLYGSPRFSEDLDFITATTKGLHAAMRGTVSHVKAAFSREFPSINIGLKVKDEEFIVDPRNPRLFILTLSEPNWHQSLKVKVEFFIVQEKLTDAYESNVLTVNSLRPRLRVDIPSIRIETADINEILCDKIHALGDRNRLKERDIFDLWWICNQQGMSPSDVSEQFKLRHEHHLGMYPQGKSLQELSISLKERSSEMIFKKNDPSEFSLISEAISRWLPDGKDSFLASKENIEVMLTHAADCANETASVIDSLVNPSFPRER